MRDKNTNIELARALFLRLSLGLLKPLENTITVYFIQMLVCSFRSKWTLTPILNNNI